MKVDRALIIRRLKVPLSMEYAQMCADSCEKHGVPYEFIDGIEFVSSEKAYELVGMKISKNNKFTTGNNNCNASHIKTWRRIVEINKPCLVLEHDAIVKGEVRNIDIPDMAVVTFGHRVGNVDMYNPIGPIEKLLSIPKTMGAHAYALTPKTAQHLVEYGETNEVDFNVDVFLMIDGTSKLPLYITEPPQVVCWPRHSTREWVEEDKARYEMGPTWTFAESNTPGWSAGFRNL